MGLAQLNDARGNRYQKLEAICDMRWLASLVSVSRCFVLDLTVLDGLLCSLSLGDALYMY